MRLTAFVVFGIALGLLVCCAVGPRRMYVLWGRALRLTFAKPQSALDDSYAVVSVPLFVLFAVDLALGVLLLCLDFLLT